MAHLNTTTLTTTTTITPTLMMESDEGPQWVPRDTIIGLVLAFSSCFFIGISVIFKKLALRDIEAQGGTRAVDGGYGYLRMPKWWLGISLMGLGELTNFVAYIFAPAILVTPLGVFSIVCTAALSPYFLKERLGKLSILGCILVLVGCVIVTLCGPKDREIASMEELQSQLLYMGFLIYAGIVVVVSVVFMLLVPRYGHRYVLLYITICSSFGSLSVMFCKGIGLALKQTIMGVNEFTNWATWVCLVALVACLVVETIYMQRALDLFNSSVFMSVNYVLFTTLVIIASSILYTELRVIGVKNIILTFLGFIVNIVALYLLHLDKEDTTTTQTKDDSQKDLPSSSQGNNNNNNNNKKANVEVATPLLNPRVPGSPLAGLNLPNTMFPIKSNSCMSLISQNSISHHHNHGPTDNHHLHTDDEDNHVAVDDNRNECSQNMGNSNGCMCELPLLSELQTCNTSTASKHHHYHQNSNNSSLHSTSSTSSQNSINNNDSRRSSCVSNTNNNSGYRNNNNADQPGEIMIGLDEGDSDSDRASNYEHIRV
ncbi:hypothetical protein Pcinc_018622 [Petrolisthes cinctipes]|uniref:Uncharacterized protein n=1 Tax=Petrolisthes cinctipes TaxID=88211 RepID=A0AAE1FLT9_PETCI|nr:hypothetical protein Pcinc_018622 [Petrolisthes cinctipes]